MSGSICNVYVEDGGGTDTVTVKAEFVLKTDKQKIERCNLGKTPQTCKLCGASGNFQTWLGVENFIGLQDEFRYFECPECDVLQIEEFPADMDKYYPKSYYSFKELKINQVRQSNKRDERMILDVGCGTGEWLCALAELGCVNLYGCDPFIDNHIVYLNGVKIRKGSIHEMHGQFDVIHLAHSFEHMPDPHEVFKSIDRLLKHGTGAHGDAPKVEIEIPVFPNLAFTIYGPFWFQMDAPRHFFLHSEKSINQLAEANGFKVTDVRHKSTAQFIKSRGYQMGASYTDFDSKIRTPEFFEILSQFDFFKVLSDISSVSKNSDTAIFTLVRK